MQLVNGQTEPAMFADGLALCARDSYMLRCLTPELLESMAEDFHREFPTLVVAQGYSLGLLMLAAELRGEAEAWS